MQKQYRNKSNPLWVAVETSDPFTININGVPTHVSFFNPLIWELVTEKQETQSLLLKDLKGKKVVFECVNKDELDKICDICDLERHTYHFAKGDLFRAWESDKIFNGQCSLGSFSTYNDLGFQIIPAASFIAANSAPDWEILEFWGNENNAIFTLEKGNYVCNTNKNEKYPLDEMINGDYSVKDGFLSIHCVRYNGNEYRVGDKAFNGYEDKAGIITGFYYENNDLTVAFDNIGGFHYSHLKPYTPPAFLLRTEDGVDVTNKKQDIYIISKSGNKACINANAALHLHEQGDLYFSTESARTAYINHNSKSMSVADLEKWDESFGFSIRDTYYLIPHSKAKKHIENGQQS